MAARRRKPDARDAPQRAVRRRSDGPAGLRKLPPDFEDLATGRREHLRPRRRPKGRIPDTRVAGLIAGVANHEARRVFDARIDALRTALAAGEETRLGRGLCDAILLGLWRARNLTGFDAVAQDVLGLAPERAARLAEQNATERGLELARLPDLAIALWLRSEAAVLERSPGTVVELRLAAGGVQLQMALSFPLAPKTLAPEALAAIGRSAAGLARVLSGEQPERPVRPREPREGSE